MPSKKALGGPLVKSKKRAREQTHSASIGLGLREKSARKKTQKKDAKLEGIQ